MESLRSPDDSGGGGFRGLVPAGGNLRAVEDRPLAPSQTGMWLALAAITMSFAALTSALIVRQGKPCGMFFQIQGPRLLKTYAVWAGEEKRILFYDCTGVRFAQTRLSAAPDPGKLAA